MSDDLVFFTNPMSRGRIARWMLEEVGQPYRTQIIEYANNKSPDYLAINPMGKVPALKHGAVLVTETAAICAYLADAFPEAGLAPPVGDKARGPYYRWLFFAAGPVEAATTNRSLGFVVPAGREVMAGYGSHDIVLNVMEQAVSASDYLADGKFSAADVYFGSQIAFGLQFGSMERRPAFVRYVERLTDRPAYQRASDIDNALMPPPPAAA